MLAILDPELRHSTPSRRQSADAHRRARGDLASSSARRRPRRRARGRPPRGSHVARHGSRRDRRSGAGDERQRPGQPRRRERRAAPRAHEAAHARARGAAHEHLDVDHDVVNRVQPRSTRRRNGPATRSAVCCPRSSRAVVPNAVSVGLDAGARALRVTAQDLMKDAPKGSKAADERARAARQGAAHRHERRAAPHRRVGTGGVRRTAVASRSARCSSAPRRERVGARDGRLGARRRRRSTTPSPSTRSPPR